MHVIEVADAEGRVSFWRAWDDACRNPWHRIGSGWFRPAFLFTFGT